MKPRHYPRATPAFRRYALLTHVAAVAVFVIVAVSHLRGSDYFGPELLVIPVVSEILIAVAYFGSKKW